MTKKRTNVPALGKIIAALTEDHRRFRGAYADFLLLDHDGIAQAGVEIVEMVVMKLEEHAALEKEFLYPALRKTVSDEEMISDALVDHNAMHTLIHQLKATASGDKAYVTTFIFLCEFAMRHARREEGEIFPELHRLPLDWERLGREMDKRREELSTHRGSQPAGNAGPGHN